MGDPDLTYQFMRWLNDTDQYGSYGSSNADDLQEIATWIENENYSTVEEVKQYLQKNIPEPIREGTKRRTRVEALADQLCENINSQKDVEELAFAATAVVRVSKRMPDVPSSDAKFAEKRSTQYLETRGEEALGDIIQKWDEWGKNGSLAAEREVIIEETEKLLGEIENEHAKKISAFVQEFERRVGNKRPSRAGDSLETVMSTILNHFDIDHEEVPQELETGFELDKMIHCNNGKYIGISCKRTLRERWKQSSNLDTTKLDTHAVDEIWHVSTLAKDLSIAKSEMLGEGRERIYVSDAASDTAEFNHQNGDHVRPMSNFITDLRQKITQ